MARNTEPTGWRPPGSMPTKPARGDWWKVPPNLRLPLTLGVGLTLLATTVAGALVASSPTKTASAAERAAIASAARTADTGPDQNPLLALLSALFPPPAPPAPAPPPPPPPPTAAPATTLVADALGSSVPVYADPNGGSVVNRVAGSNVLDQREAFVVTDASVPGWYQVELPVKPNGSTGWIQASSVSTRTDTYRIRVHQSQFKLDLFNNGALQQSFRVAVGAPSTPTPNGNLFVWATQDWNSAPYPGCIFA